MAVSSLDTKISIRANDMISEKEQRATLESFVVANKDLDELEAKISRFNIFEAVGMVRQEIKHSNFLQFLLNPSEKHQLGDLFLKEMLIEVFENVEDSPIDELGISVANFNDAEVWREWHNIDLVIHSPSNNLVCTIENKVDSVEGHNQLITYQEVMSREFPHYKKLFIYLTKDGDAASQPEWLSLSYGSVSNIIEKILKDRQAKLGQDIVISLRHYTDLVRRHFMSESDIAELCRKIYKQHRQAIDLIYEHRPDLRSELEEIIEKKIQQSLESDGLVKDSTYKRWIRFAPREWDELAFQKTCEKWSESKRILLFEFWNDPQNLKLSLVVGPGDIEIKQAIYQSLRALPIRGLRTCRIKESGWNHICAIPVLNTSHYEDGDLEDLQEKINAFWINYLNGDLKIIRQAISQAFQPITS